MFKENNSTSISSKSRNGALKKQPTSKIHNAKAVAENQLLGINRMVDLKIIVEGKIIKYFHHLSLKQSSSNHHSFKLKLPYDALGNPENHELNEAQNFLGKRITIVFAYKGLTETPERTFVGVILEVTYEQEQGSLGSIVLIGNSPTLLLDAATHTQSFGGSQSISLNSIAESVIKEGLSSSQFDYRVDSAYIKNISYSSQYNETHYNYLARMAEAYGEQFFYDGEVLHFGTLPPQETPIELIYGSNVSDIKIKMKALHVNPTFYGYNSSKNEKLTSGNSSINHNSDIAKRAYQISQQTFQTPSLRVAPIKATTYKDVDASQKGTAGSQASEVFITSGKTSIPFMYPGCIAEIKMRKNTSNKTSYFTKLMVTEVHHEVDGRGNYEGNFQAIAADSGFLPRPIFENPLAEAQVATVISNTDPENQGRIQVRFDWQLHDTTEFIRVMTPDAGSSGKVSKNRGFMAIPEVGDQVMVNFQHNHPDRPFVMGGLFHGKVGGGGGSGNNIKSLSSKSGHIIELNDGGGMMIRDKNGNHVTLSGDGDITTQVSNDNTENIGNNHTTNVKTKSTTNVGENQSVLTMGNDGVIDLSGKTSVKIKVSETSYIEITSGQISIVSDVIEIKGKNSVSNISEDQVFIKASGASRGLFKGCTKITGDQVDIN